MFIDRARELAFLNQMLKRARPGPAQLLLMYGRRRIGKSKLLLHWMERSKLGATYWAAEKEARSTLIPTSRPSRESRAR